MGNHHPVVEGTVQQKGEGRANSLSLSWDNHLLMVSDTDDPGSQALRCRLNYITGFPGFQLADRRL